MTALSRRHPLVAALASCLALLMLWPGPVDAKASASAVSSQAPKDWKLDPATIKKPKGIVPRLGVDAAPPSNAASTNPACPTCNPPLLFTRGYPVMGGLTGTPGAVYITPVYWAPTGYSFTASYKSIINGYLSNVALDSQKPTNVFSVATQYYQQSLLTGAPLQHIVYKVTAGAELDDPDPFPPQTGSGCQADAGFTACVTDAAQEAELRSFLNAKSLPIDDAHLYVVMFPPAVETCFYSGPKSATNPCSTNVYCAYHSAGATAPWLIYTNQPYPDLAHCADPYNGAQAPNGDAAADAQVSLVSHEASEAITNWSGAWVDSAGKENGDQCSRVYGTPLGSTGGAGTYYNQVVGNGQYYTQDEFSNEDYALGTGDKNWSGGVVVNGCEQREELPTAAFTNPATVYAGYDTAFDGSASSDPDASGSTDPARATPLTYSWNWGDGTALGPGATPTHVFYPAGVYAVTLTVTDIDGWSASLAKTLTVIVGVPVVASVKPKFGYIIGGAAVSLTGYSFTGATGVSFGGTPATSFTVRSDQAIDAVAPAHAAGLVDVIVTNANGPSVGRPSDQYNYIPMTNYFSWFDKATPGMTGDNIHVLNTSGLAAHVTVSMPGAAPINVTVATGAEQYVTFPQGSIGGPVVVDSDQPILASQRVQYYGSFNEVWGMTLAQASTTAYVNWFDKASPGMVGDNIHVLNPGSGSATVTVSIPNYAPQTITVAPGGETYVTFPNGTIGGPVKITSSAPVLAAQRVQYYQTFNEVVARGPGEAQTTSYFNWFDKASPGMVGDNVHILNPGSTIAAGTVDIPGQAAIPFQVSPGAQTYVTYNPGVIGGRVRVTANQPVLASQRVQYYQSFNEVSGMSQGQAMMTSHVMWFDKATPGMMDDNIHIYVPPGVTLPVHVTVIVPGASPVQTTIAAADTEVYVTFPPNTIGGPVTITADQPVLAAQRVQYYQTFNEVPAV